MIENASRCPDDQCGRVCQAATFHVDIMSPVTAYYLETAFQGTEYLFYLQGQFSRWGRMIACAFVLSGARFSSKGNRKARVLPDPVGESKMM